MSWVLKPSTIWGTPEALDVFFNEKSSTELGEHSRKIGLEPNVFVFQDAVWNNPDEAVRADSLKHFEKAAQTAKMDWLQNRIRPGSHALWRDSLDL